MAYEISFFPDRIHQNSLQHFNIGRLGSKGLFQTNHAPNRWTLTSTFLHLQRNHNIHVRTYSYNVKLPVLIKYSSVAHWPHSSSFSHEQRFGKKIMSNSDGSNLIGIAFIFYSLLIYSTLRVRVNSRLRLTPNPEQAQIIIIYAIQCFTFPFLDTLENPNIQCAFITY